MMFGQTTSRRRFWSRRAQSLVESALVIPLFFLLVFAILDLGRLYFVQVTLQHAMRQAGRFAVTGNRLTDPSTGNNLSRVDSIIVVAKRAAGLEITNIQIGSLLGGSAGPGRAGGPGDTVTIALTTDLKLITSMIGRYFGASNTYTFIVAPSFATSALPPANKCERRRSCTSLS
jgi:Flp pilus assembly protein TadG